MSWTWDEEKNQVNQCKHGLEFEVAQYVFSDPLSLSQPDPYPYEERWQTIGLVGNMMVFVVHTWPEDREGRIISARRATAQERRIYEEEAF